jgi:hypothetical protein
VEKGRVGGLLTWIWADGVENGYIGCKMGTWGERQAGGMKDRSVGWNKSSRGLLTWIWVRGVEDGRAGWKTGAREKDGCVGRKTGLRDERLV